MNTDVILGNTSDHGQKLPATELLKLVNAAREQHDERPVRRNDFIARCQDELEGDHYETFVVTNPNQTQSVELRLTMDQAMLVLMRESKLVRRKVLEQLHALQSRPFIPQTLPDALRLAADLAEQNNSLRLVVQQQAPKVEALARIADASGTMCLTDAAKHLGVQRKDLLEWLQANRWIYRREGAARWLGYEPRLRAGLLDHKVTVLGLDDLGQQRLASQVRVTPRGLTVLAQKLGRAC